MGTTWRDRLVYAAVWLACASPLAWLVYLGLTGGLTANPIEKVIRTLGDFGLYILIVSLMVTPASRLLKQPGLIRFRRTIGLWAFAFVTLHLSTYIGIDQFFDWGQIGKDIVKRPFITIGMLAFVLLIPLAVTSTNGMLRRLGPKRWRKLHQLIYVIAPLGIVHYYLMVKLDTRPVLAFGAVVAALLAYRVFYWDQRRRRKAARRPTPAAAQTKA